MGFGEMHRPHHSPMAKLSHSGGFRKGDNDARKKIYLSEDFYAMAYLGYTKEVVQQYEINNQQLGRNFYSCLWIFGVELTLAWLIIKTVVLDEDHFVIYTPNIEVYICRFVTALLLHMELIEDVK